MFKNKLIRTGIITLSLPFMLTSCFLQPTDDPIEDTELSEDSTTVTDSAINTEEVIDTAAILSEIQTYSDPYPLTEIAPKLQVVDESLSNPSVQLLVLKLKDAVDKKDIEGLLSLLSEDIKYNYSSETSGKDGFMTYWELDSDPLGTDLWVILEDLLGFGVASIDEETYVIPYTYATLSSDYNAVIINDIVNLRADATTNSTIRERLNYDYVNLLEITDSLYNVDGIDYNWVKIQSSYGTTGYVVAKYLYSENSYRIDMTKDGNEWIITAIIPSK